MVDRPQVHITHVRFAIMIKQANTVTPALALFVGPHAALCIATIPFNLLDRGPGAETEGGASFALTTAPVAARFIAVLHISARAGAGSCI